jgi:hypothetical protein
MDFNEVMTKEINRKIKKQVDNDFRFLRDIFLEFVNKYHCVEVGDYDRIKEYTLKSLSEGNEFIMFPELREFLFKREVENMINKVLYL